MYHHFRGKRDLARAAIERAAADLAARADADLDGPGTVPGRIARYMRRERCGLSSRIWAIRRQSWYQDGAGRQKAANSCLIV
jgi:AcrR family transcriptional regulator